MAKFVELSEAAKMLGLSPEQLVEMRSSGDIHGYRDGSSWKFKIEEIERVAAERSSDEMVNSLSPDVKEPGSDVGDGSILVSEEELGHSGESTSSTIIGETGAPKTDSDLKLSPDSDVSLVPSSADTDPTLDAPEVESDVQLVPGLGIDSDVSLVPDAGSEQLLSDSDLDESASTGGTGRLDAVDSDMSIGSSDLDVTLDSELALSDDDEVVLGGSGLGSDLTLGAADSGINLSSPSDSGLSLEADSGINLQTPTDSGLSLEDEPLDVGGSSISSLELPEDEEVLALEEDETPAVKKDEEFLLSPSDDMFGDESDSGSQVIALEDSEAFDEEAAQLMQPGEEGLLAETQGLEQQLDTLGGEAAPMAGMAPAGYAGPVEPPEAPYSIWNVMGLLMVLLLLTISGILMTDIVQNMWAWEEGRSLSTGLSDGITSAIFGR